MADKRQSVGDGFKNSSCDTSEDMYEILPHTEIAELKDELRKYREDPTISGKHLQLSVDELVHRLDRLTKLIEYATDQIKLEEGGLSFKETMMPLMEKLDRVLDQNSEIAEGVVAVADMVKEFKEKWEEEKSKPINPMDGPPTDQFGTDFGLPPPPGQPTPQTSFGMPPRFATASQGMPPPPPRRRGLFGF